MRNRPPRPQSSSALPPAGGFQPPSLTRYFFVLALILLLFNGPNRPTTRAAPQALRIDYAVKVADLNQRTFHIRAEVKNIHQPILDLSLPTWTPGWYTIEDYAKNFLHFTATLADGRALPWTKTFKHTWRFDTHAIDRFTVDFDYLANTLELNQCEITSRHAFFNGTAFFLFAEGHLNSPSTVRIEKPEGWEIVTALDPSLEPGTFAADNYHTLVDSPTLIGLFDRERFETSGSMHEVVFDPQGATTPGSRADFVGQVRKIVDAEAAIFGGLPYRRYVFFYFFSHAGGSASGGLEHANSHVGIVGPEAARSLTNLKGLVAHEFFHAWNVKRIRPAEMWPYNYIHEPYTPSLWVSEGFTDYYTHIALRRAGLEAAEVFLLAQAREIAALQQNDARRYISAAQASIDTWLGYDSPQAFTISYYTKGHLLGLLLDLSIRKDTAGVAGLDDVMRSLYKEFYLQGRGFTVDDLVRVINRVSHRDYKDFFNRFVSATEELPYDQYLGYAGYNLSATVRTRPSLGMETDRRSDGSIVLTGFAPNSPAQRAGLLVGDRLVQVGDIKVENTNWTLQFRDTYADRIGQKIRLSIVREGKEMNYDMEVASRSDQQYALKSVDSPTETQLKIREAWLR